MTEHGLDVAIVPNLTYGLNLDCTWNGFDLSAQFTGGALFDVSLTGTYYNGYDDNTVWTQAFKEGSQLTTISGSECIYVDNPNGTFPRLNLVIKDTEEIMD
ncbi:hypothetical protein NXV28_00155 [Bacteroides ovatus]|uniref:hypothetical protein n=1 Tax=Bacteroides ovatus TaxID=28116 RepID=UPI0021659097|nr:hypothetical protein [Bacteroides ovatus]MCS2799158.1 hypothetical protein [Bacteroides ovatus]